MKKFFGFLFIVLLIILIIFFSNRYYSKKEKANNLIEAGKEKVDVIKHKKVDLDEVDSSDTKNKDSEETTDVVKVEEKDDSKSNTNTNTNTTNNNSAVVPNTASDDEDGYVKVESYEVLLNKDSIKVGESTRVKVNVKPQNASEKDVTYLSKTPNVCSVSAMGKINGLASGDCLIFINVKNASSHKLLIRIY